MNFKIVGIDPGTGVSSPTGIAIFDSEGTIDFKTTISCNYKDGNKRLRYISDTLKDLTNNYDGIDLVCIETFVMRGKGGQTLQRMIGAAIATVKHETPIQEVYNTTVKRLVGGTGKADKAQVGEGVYKWFHSKNQDSSLIIRKLYMEDQWDILDAFAIGISGYQLFIGEDK